MAGEPKNVYLDSEVIAYVDRQREKEGRSFSNYLTMLIREDMKKKRVKK